MAACHGASDAAKTRRRATLPVARMTCASCVRHVEKALVNQPGVVSAWVNLGAFWVGMLTLIVLMPIVIPAARRRSQAPEPAEQTQEECR
jgi:P-type Cu+ transporter